MLDPQRVGLNAASVGFLKRTGQKVDWDSFNKALQTDSCVNVRRELKETPISEVHVMGGELFGFAGDSKTNELERQRMQINGYVLRAFDASQPAVILPKKYGGFPTYVKNAAEGNFVSVFCEPMSAVLQKDTELLGRQGKSALSFSSSRPYEPQGFITPLTNTKAEVINNTQILEMRKTALIQSRRGQRQKLNIAVNASGHAYYDNGPDYDANGVPDDPLIASDPQSIMTMASIAKLRGLNAFQQTLQKKYLLQNRQMRGALMSQNRTKNPPTAMGANVERETLEASKLFSMAANANPKMNESIVSPFTNYTNPTSSATKSKSTIKREKRKLRAGLKTIAQNLNPTLIRSTRSGVMSAQGGGGPAI